MSRSTQTLDGTTQQLSEGYMGHEIRCRCGTLKGEVAYPEKGVHGVCYCQDCQTYGRYLGGERATLDSNGGTEVVATQSSYLKFISGQEMLACHSLTENGLLRWYARCCNTPIANTLRKYKLPYVGLVHTCLGDAAAIERAFGPVRMRVNTNGAKSSVQSMTASKIFALLGFVPSLVLARLSGSYKNTPFFNRNGELIGTPKVLTAAERQAAASAV